MLQGVGKMRSTQIPRWKVKRIKLSSSESQILIALEKDSTKTCLKLTRRLLESTENRCMKLIVKKARLR